MASRESPRHLPRASIPAALTLAVLVAQAPARAAPADENEAIPSTTAGAAAETPKETAQRLLHEGFQLLDEGDMASALVRFREAYATFPRAHLLLNIASTLRQVGKNAEAASVYRRYLVEAGAASARRAHVERILREIALVVGTVRIQVGAANVTLLVDGQPVVGGAVRAVEVDVGKHIVVAIVMGRPRAVETVDVAAGREVSLVLNVKEDAPPRLLIVKESLPPVQVAGVVLAAVGVAAIGVGSGFGIAAMNDERALEGHCAAGFAVCDPTAEKLADSATFKARVSTRAFMAGGSAALVGAVLLVLGKRAAPPMKVQPAAAVESGRLWLGLGGTW